MKSHTQYLTFNVTSKMAFENIGPLVEEAVRKSGVAAGLGHGTSGGESRGAFGFGWIGISDYI